MQLQGQVYTIGERENTISDMSCQHIERERDAYDESSPSSLVLQQHN